MANKKLTPTGQMISQLMNQKHSKTDAIRIVSEIERNQIFNYLYRYKQKPETVGSYFKKHQKKCLRKFLKE